MLLLPLLHRSTLSDLHDLGALEFRQPTRELGALPLAVIERAGMTMAVHTAELAPAPTRDHPHAERHCLRASAKRAPTPGHGGEKVGLNRGENKEIHAPRPSNERLGGLKKDQMHSVGFEPTQTMSTCS